jgi:hypothetical protein
MKPCLCNVPLMHRVLADLEAVLGKGKEGLGFLGHVLAQQVVEVQTKVHQGDSLANIIHVNLFIRQLVKENVIKKNTNYILL